MEAITWRDEIGKKRECSYEVNREKGEKKHTVSRGRKNNAK